MLYFAIFLNLTNPMPKILSGSILPIRQRYDYFFKIDILFNDKSTDYY